MASKAYSWSVWNLQTVLEESKQFVTPYLHLRGQATPYIHLTKIITDLVHIIVLPHLELELESNGCQWWLYTAHCSHQRYNMFVHWWSKLWFMGCGVHTWWGVLPSSVWCGLYPPFTDNIACSNSDSAENCVWLLMILHKIQGHLQHKQRVIGYTVCTSRPNHTYKIFRYHNC